MTLRSSRYHVYGDRLLSNPPDELLHLRVAAKRVDVAEVGLEVAIVEYRVDLLVARAAELNPIFRLATALARREVMERDQMPRHLSATKGAANELGFTRTHSMHDDRR
jgi:hypothetical protein